MIRPLGKRVLVLPEAYATQTASGIYLPPTAQGNSREAVVKGTVVAVGGEVTDVYEGNEVYYTQYAGVVVKIDNEEHTILKVDEVLGVVE